MRISDLIDLINPAKITKIITQKITLPPFKGKDLWKLVVFFQFLYSLAGLVSGLACVIGGIVLLLHGITGSTSWTTKALGLESNLNDASPGVILFVVGLFVVWITRFDVETKKVE